MRSLLDIRRKYTNTFGAIYGFEVTFEDIFNYVKYETDVIKSDDICFNHTFENFDKIDDDDVGFLADFLFSHIPNCLKQIDEELYFILRMDINKFNYNKTNKIYIGIVLEHGGCEDDVNVEQIRSPTSDHTEYLNKVKEKYSFIKSEIGTYIYHF